MARVYCHITAGNDTTGDGSSATPYRNIDKIVTATRNGAGGDTGYVGFGGTYTKHVNVFGGPHAAGITLQPWNSNSAPIITPATNEWEFKPIGATAAQGWTIDNFIFRDVGTAFNRVLELGDNNGTSSVESVTFQNCEWRHNRVQAVDIRDSSGVTFTSCLFLDIRSNTAGVAEQALLGISTANVRNLKLSNCRFVDIGDDCYDGHAGNVEAHWFRCTLGDNRPYGSVTESWHDATEDPTSWHSYRVQNVGAIKLDFAGVVGTAANKIVVEKCLIFGGRATLAGQDSGTGKNGPAISMHEGTQNINVRDCIIYDNDWGMRWGSSGDQSNNTNIRRNLFVGQRKGNLSVFYTTSATIEDNLIVSSVGTAALNVGCAGITFQYNTIVDGTLSRGTGSTETFDYNIWNADQSASAQWIGANDPGVGGVRWEYAWNGDDLVIQNDNNTAAMTLPFKLVDSYCPAPQDVYGAVRKATMAHQLGRAHYRR